MRVSSSTPDSINGLNDESVQDTLDRLSVMFRVISCFCIGFERHNFSSLLRRKKFRLRQSFTTESNLSAMLEKCRFLFQFLSWHPSN